MRRIDGANILFLLRERVAKDWESLCREFGGTGRPGDTPTMILHDQLLHLRELGLIEFEGDAHPWRFLQLRDEGAANVSFEKEFAVFKEMEKARTARIYQQAKMLRVIAGLVVLAVCGLLVFWVLAWFKARHQIPR